MRRLNLVTEPDRYPLPNMMDFADRLNGCCTFSKINLRKGYWQIPMSKDNIAKTAVITPFGLYEFLVMSFGLRNAGSSFQRMMDRVIRGLPFVFCYLDDLRIASRSPQELITYLFQRLREFGLVINLEKCTFNVSKIEFLGHTVSAQGALPLLKRQGCSEVPRAGNNQGDAGVPRHGELLQTLHTQRCPHFVAPH